MKKIHILGGGTHFHVRPHLSLSAPAGGSTARFLYSEIKEGGPYFNPKTTEVELHLTKMADPKSKMDTNEDVSNLVDQIIADPASKIVFFTVAMCDFEGYIQEEVAINEWADTESGKDQPRLLSKEGHHQMSLYPAPKVISRIREQRKDIFLVGFKTTAGATEDQQFAEALTLCKKSHCNLVLANDLHTRVNMIVTPEQSRYCVTGDREKVLKVLLNITSFRSLGTYARTHVVDGSLTPFDSELVPPTLRTVVEFCVKKGAYQPFNDVTVGHFAAKQKDGSVLCSIRKRNYNKKIELVRLESVDDNVVVAYGAKPSAGARSQWIMFNDHPEMDCVVHFHCPMKEGSKVPVRQQWLNECGSHQCGKNTSEGLVPVSEDGKIKAVFLDNHGPNILFSSDVDPQRVIEFIEDNFDLSKTTRGDSYA